MPYILYFTKKMHAFAGKILYVNLMGMALISLLNGIGIFLIIPLLGVSGIVDLNMGIGAFYGMFDFLQQFPKSVGLLIILGVYVLLVIGQTWLQRNLSLRDVRIHTGFINHIRLEVYRALIQSNWDFFIKKRKSDLINSLTDELGRVMGGTYMFLQFLASLVFTFIQVCVALWLSVKMTVLVIICGLVIALFSRRFIKQSKALGNQTSELARDYIGGITDDFNGIKDIKSNMLERSRINWLEAWCRKVELERYGHASVGTKSQLYYKICSAIFIACFIFVSIHLFNAQAGQLLLVVLIFARLWPRFTGIQSSLEQIAAAVPAFQSLMVLQRECMNAAETDGGASVANSVRPIELEAGIECQDINFRYQSKQTVYALSNISLFIPSHRMTAIVGRSGAGKSTLIDLIMGLLQPESGRVLIDHVPLAGDRIMAWRRSISYVPQEPFLFNGSIRDNMLMMESGASDEQIWEALDAAAAAEFVRRLPQGLDTHIGDRGIRLSGGERQRIVLARAILRKPSILILDEATSALDAENEARIHEALERLKGKMTMIIIAHRLSTLRNADQVIVLDQGEVVQLGDFEQLAEDKEGQFSRLLGSQLQTTTMIA